MPLLLLRNGCIRKHGTRSKSDTISVSEGMLIDTIALINQPIETVQVFNHPCSLFPIQLGVAARDTPRGYHHIIGEKATNGEYRLISIKLPLFNHLPIDFKHNACLKRG